MKKRNRKHKNFFLVIKIRNIKLLIMVYMCFCGVRSAISCRMNVWYPPPGDHMQSSIIFHEHKCMFLKKFMHEKFLKEIK